MMFRSVHELIALLSEPAQAVFACQQLKERGPEALEAAEPLVEIVAQADMMTAPFAAGALTAIGPSALDAICGGLQSCAAEAQLEELLKVVRSFGEDGAPAVPALAQFLRAAPDSDAARMSALRTLQAIGPASVDAKAEIVSELGHSVDAVALCAVEALSAIGIPAFDDLLEVSQRDKPQFRGRAARALGRISTCAVPRLTELLEDPNDKVRAEASEGLAFCGKDAVKPLMARLPQEPNAKVKVWFCQAFGCIGKDAHDAQALMIGVLENEAKALGPDAEQRVLDALSKTGASDLAFSAIKAILVEYREKRSNVHAVADAAAKALWAWKENPELTVNLLSRLLDTRPEGVRKGVCHAVGFIGEPALCVLEKLLEQASGEHVVIQKDVAFACSGVGPSAFSLLRRDLRGDNPGKAYIAMQVVGELARKLRFGSPGEHVKHPVPKKPPAQWFTALKNAVFDPCVALLKLDGISDLEATGRISEVQAFGVMAVEPVLNVWITYPKHRNYSRLFLKDNLDHCMSRLLDLLRSRNDLQPALVELFAWMGPEAHEALNPLRALEGAAWDTDGKIGEAIAQIDR